MKIDYFGQGQCDCSPGFLFHQDQCYEVGTQGPCEDGEFFTITSENFFLCHSYDDYDSEGDTSLRFPLITLNLKCEDDEKIGPKGKCIKINQPRPGRTIEVSSCDLRCHLKKILLAKRG